MLLKAAILQQTGRIHDEEAKYTYGFDRCLLVATDELALLTPDERSTLSILDAQRDQAAHYYCYRARYLMALRAGSSMAVSA
jgi:hypothetical protein